MLDADGDLRGSPSFLPSIQPSFPKSRIKQARGELSRLGTMMITNLGQAVLAACLPACLFLCGENSIKANWRRWLFVFSKQHTFYRRGCRSRPDEGKKRKELLLGVKMDGRNFCRRRERAAPDRFLRATLFFLPPPYLDRFFFVFRLSVYS